MKFTELGEGSYERAQEKKVRLAKLYNQRAELRDQLKQAREEGDEAKVDMVSTKLGRLEDSIDALAESASPAAAAKARLAQLKADLAALPQNPGSQDGYDALDELRDKIKAAEAKVAQLTETGPVKTRDATNDPTIAYEEARARAVKALQDIAAQVDKFTAAAKRNSRDWGYPGSMGHVAAKLEEVRDFFGN